MIVVVVGDLASVAADAVVRPADATLAPVSEALRRLDAAAGPSLAGATGNQTQFAVGSAFVTGGGALTAELIIHAIVGQTPADATPDTLRRALEASLWQCTRWHIAALAVPALDGVGTATAADVMQVMLQTFQGPMRNAEYPATVLIVTANPQERERYEARLPKEGNGR